MFIINHVRAPDSWFTYDLSGVINDSSLLSSCCPYNCLFKSLWLVFGGLPAP